MEGEFNHIQRLKTSNSFTVQPPPDYIEETISYFLAEIIPPWIQSCTLIVVVGVFTCYLYLKGRPWIYVSLLHTLSGWIVGRSLGLSVVHWWSGCSASREAIIDPLHHVALECVLQHSQWTRKEEEKEENDPRSLFFLFYLFLQLKVSSLSGCHLLQRSGLLLLFYSLSMITFNKYFFIIQQLTTLESSQRAAATALWLIITLTSPYSS